MKSNLFHRRFTGKAAPARGQRGVVLFLALVCLLAIMLAAVALVRSVDTSTIIAGNVALQQGATRSGDLGAESAITWLAATQATNISKNVLLDTNHPFNQNAPTSGYYARLDTALSLTASSGTRIAWTSADSAAVNSGNPDPSGNVTRYVIQRVCQTAGVGVKDAACLLSSATVDNNNQNVQLPQDICNGLGCPAAGQTPQIRITTRTTGPRNSLSYVQTFVY